MLVNPYNHREIAQSVYDVLTEEYLREKLIKAGIENVKKYSWLETAKRILQLFEKVSQS